ncbi:MAG: ferritin-like domain-containing protein [Polyangiaceae bacterium]
MRKEQLLGLLAVAVALPSSFAVGCVECPTVDIVEEANQSLDADAACEVFQQLENTFEGTNVPASVCAEHCGDPKWDTCYLDSDYLQAGFALDDNGGAGGAGGSGGEGGAVGVGAKPCPQQSATLTCQVTKPGTQLAQSCAVPGRKPEGLADIALDTQDLGRFLASSAYFEAGAALAFEGLAVELGALGAPEDLVSDLLLAARDEVRHAATMTKLAARHGATPRAASVGEVRDRSFEDIATENAVEGLVHETFAAATALFQAEHAEDPELRRAMRKIAADECAHAALAFRIGAFLASHLDEEARARVEAKRVAAVRALALSFNEPGAEVRRRAGVPTRAEAIAVHRRMCESVWGLSSKNLVTRVPHALTA